MKWVTGLILFFVTLTAKVVMAGCILWSCGMYGCYPPGPAFPYTPPWGFFDGSASWSVGCSTTGYSCADSWTTSNMPPGSQVLGSYNTIWGTTQYVFCYLATPPEPPPSPPPAPPPPPPSPTPTAPTVSFTPNPMPISIQVPVTRSAGMTTFNATGPSNLIINQSVYPGTYYFILVFDSGQQLASGIGNDSACAAVCAGPVNLAPEQLGKTLIVRCATPPTSFTPGCGSAAGLWTDVTLTQY